MEKQLYWAIRDSERSITLSVAALIVDDPLRNADDIAEGKRLIAEIRKSLDGC